ncbi:zinc-binding alcohol dehydrogenase family protein [Acidisoma sp. C75]
MRAVGYKVPQAIDHPEALVDITLPRPRAEGRDLLVEIRAIAVNPVDTKVRMRGGAADGGWRVLGWDAAGVVAETGPDVVGFKPGDAVFYAGALDAPGTNAEFHLVDERIVGRKPESLSFAQAAALPLTAITAWEGLFDRLDVKRPVPGAARAILIIGGAGGVASIAIQLAKRLTDLAVIATASRPETAEWVRALGADHVVNHTKPLAAELAALGLGQPGFVYSTTQTDKHLSEIGALIAPQGRFVLIDDPGPLDVTLFKRKSVSTHWEFMFTRSMFATADMAEQGALLNAVSRLVEEGAIRSTLGEHYGAINAGNLRRAHAMLESGKAVGKIVLEGF